MAEDWKLTEAEQSTEGGLTAIGVLQEGDAERHKHKAANDEVGRHAVHTVQHRDKRPACQHLVAELCQLAVSQHFEMQMIPCISMHGTCWVQPT